MALKAPKNLRKIRIRCCVTCAHYVSREVVQTDRIFAVAIPWKECERDDSATTESEEDYEQICDYFKHEEDYE